MSPGRGPGGFLIRAVWVNATAHLDLAGVGLAVLALAGPSLGLGRDHGHAGAVDRDIEHVRQRPGGRHQDHLAGGDAAARASIARRRPGRRPRRGGPARLPVRVIPASSPTSLAAAANGTAAAARRSSSRSPGDMPLPGYPQLRIARREAVPAVRAVIPGPAHRDRAEHRVHGLIPAGRESRLVPGCRNRCAGRGSRRRRPAGLPASRAPSRISPARIAVSAASSPAPPASDAAAPRPAALPPRPPPPRAARRALAEPPLPLRVRGLPAGRRDGGRASQIASLTSSISSASAANS